MPHLTWPTLSAGPVVDLFVTISSTRAAVLISGGVAVPNGVTVRALIDTGASGTLIDEAALRPLNLSPTGTVRMHSSSTAGAAVACFQYDLFLAIIDPRSKFYIGNRPVTATNLDGTNIQALIGRDVLGKCLFLYDGTAQTFTLGF